jgi:hypothetical protein
VRVRTGPGPPTSPRNGLRNNTFGAASNRRLLAIGQANETKPDAVHPVTSVPSPGGGGLSCVVQISDCAHLPGRRSPPWTAHARSSKRDGRASHNLGHRMSVEDAVIAVHVVDDRPRPGFIRLHEAHGSDFPTHRPRPPLESAAAPAVAAVVSLVVGVTTPPRSGRQFCSDGCVAYHSAVGRHPDWGLPDRQARHGRPPGDALGGFAVRAVLPATTS